MMTFREAAKKLIDALNGIEAEYPGFYAGPEDGTFYLYDPQQEYQVSGEQGRRRGCFAGCVTPPAGSAGWAFESWYEADAGGAPADPGSAV